MGVFPTTAPTNDAMALSDLINTLIANGYTPDSGLDAFGILCSAARQLVSGRPSSSPQTTFGATAGANLSETVIMKSVTAIVDAVATSVLTITVPNAPVSALLRVRLSGSLGAGGAIGAYEASCGVTYDFQIVRTAGVAAVDSTGAS